MIKNSALGFCIAATALVLSGCEVPVDDGTSSSTDNNDFTTITRDGNVDVVMNFAMDSAVALVANADITEGTRSLETGLFEYRIIGGSRTRMGISERAVLSRDSSDASEVVGSNLLALDDQGDLTPAMETNFPTKVMYSVGSPSGNKIYLALDPGWFDDEQAVDADGRRIDFSRVIAETKCALMEVTVATNEHSCVAEGIFVQNMNDEYRQAVSGNQKPIQFDGDGNLYFAGTTFSVQEDSWTDCFFDDQNDQEICEIRTNKWLDTTDWQPRIFRRLVGEDTATAITQDNEYIEFFSVLKSGELVYQSRNESTWSAELKMLQGDSVIDLSSGWGLDFFTVDDSNTVIFGAEGSGSAANGLRFARPRAAGGVEKASLDTSLFGGDSGGSGWGNPKPRRLLVGDNGRIYGVFEGGRDTIDANGVHSGWETTLTVYQILPVDGVPKLELVLADGVSWWDWMQNTPFQVSGDTLYYSDSVDVPFLGTANVIIMVDLTTRLQTQLLTPVDGVGRYEIYNWRLAGDELHFSGLKKDNNSVVTGVIETARFTPETDSSVYLTVTESASASGAASAIQDIEVLRTVSTEIDPGDEPNLTFFQSMDNLYSMSIDFSTSMNTASVEENLSLVDGASNPIDMMKIWVNKTLHLIPDLDVTGLSDSTGTAPLAANTAYTLTVAATTNDVFGNALVSDASQTVTTRPSSGWYVDTNETLLYAGRGDGTRKWSTYDLVGASAPDHFELTFDAKNFNWQGVELYLFDVASGLPNQRTDFRMGLGSWSWVDYEDTTNNWHWIDGETRSVFNGSWKTYRIRVFGNDLMVDTKVLGENDTAYEAVGNLTVTDLATRSGTDNRILLRVQEPVGFDNFILNSLDSNGDISVNDVYTEDFSGGIPTAYNTDLTDTYDDIYD